MDKYRGITRLPLVEARINQLLGRMSANRAVGSYRTQEEIVRAYADIANQILKGFDKRVYNLPKVARGTPINEVDMNLYLLGIYSEIRYLLDAVKNTAEMTEENFNFAIATIRNLQAGVRYCRRQLSTFALYATQFDGALHFGETFANETHIDRGTNLLAQEECFIDLAEGTISLPRLEEEDRWEIKEIQIGANSNGNLGSNVEKGTPIRGSITSMHDSNVDTWTEYERVVGEEDISGLKLELKVILSDVRPVNGIKIHPVFLGARTPFAIRAIEVSSDGREWISLKNDVRVADFLDEDPEERFHLSPHSSRFSGEFNITFAPRFVKFIRILIRQSSAFPIFDVYGDMRLRYAIAIKEIEVYGHKYSSAGELISKPVEFGQDINALGISSLVDPPLLPPEVGGAEYFISYDDGASWAQLTSLEEASLDIPEVLYPPAGTSSVRYKLSLKKDELAFSQQTSKGQARNFIERFGWSTRRPFVLNLLHKPEKDSVSVCDPEAATRGKVYPRVSLGTGVASSLATLDGSVWERHGNTQLRLRLPLKSIKDPSTIFIYVNGQLWSRVATVSDFSNYHSKEYVLARDTDQEFWELVFGNDETEGSPGPRGRIPGPGDEISLYLSEESCVVEGLAAPYKLKLDYPSDGVKENTLVRFHGGVYATPPETMPSGVTKFKLSRKNILVGDSWGGVIYHVGVAIRGIGGGVGFEERTSSGDVSPPLTGSFRQYKTFVDGYSELSTDGDWTVDKKGGAIYLYKDTPTESDKEYTITYWWEDVIDLVPSDWDFVPGKLDEINVYESGYKTKDAEYTLGSSLSASADDRSVTIVDADSLRVRGVVAKSLRIQDGTLNGYKAFEVPFIDGRKEFLGRARIQDETVPRATSGSVPGHAGDAVAGFRVTHYQNLVNSAAPFFPNDPEENIFIVEKANYASLIAAGDFFFDTEGDEPGGPGYLYVRLAATGLQIDSGQVISYQYYDEFSTERMKGAYSVDPVGGVLYFSEPLVAGDLTKTISFKYTPYRVRYNVAVELEEGKDFEIDYEKKAVRILSGAAGAREDKIAVKYKYQPEGLKSMDLAPYFSPLVRAIDIKVS